MTKSIIKTEGVTVSFGDFQALKEETNLDSLSRM